MASKAPDLPESLVVGAFAGLRNTIAAERLQPSDLAAAVNVDLDDAGQIRRRRGRTQISAAAHHSLVQIAEQHLVVRDGVLGSLSSGYVFTPLREVGPQPLSYTAVGRDIYFSSAVTNGKIIDGAYQLWGSQDGPRWISPVVTPTETLGQIKGRLLGAPPVATQLEHYKGRIYLAAGPVLWATELYLYDLVDKTKNFVVLEDDITMLAAVTDGIYVGTRRQLIFLRGILSKGMEMTVISDTPVVEGSVVWVPLSKVHPQARGGAPVPERDSPVFMTGAGIMLGLDGGQVYNLTQDRVVFPDAQRAAALYREDQGVNSYVAVADSAGGPSTNARIGDFVDAQIVRASQRG